MKILVLDIGGIFFSPAWRVHGISEVSRKLHIEGKVFKAALGKYKEIFYTGKISETEYWNKVLKILKIQRRKSSDLKRFYRSYITPIPRTLNILPTLSSKFTLIACNNSPKEWMDYRINIASLDKYFSQFFTSGYVGYMKPEAEMFTKILDSYNINDLIYVDDNDEYVSIARDKYGINSRLYNKPDDLLQLIR